MFLINNEVIFDPVNLALKSTKNNEEITLFSTSSLCLEELIENHGKIVSKSAVLNRVWGERASIVTDNAYYQMVLNLRTCVKNVGLKDDIIKTIPRKGLSIPNYVTISKIEGENTDNYKGIVRVKRKNNSKDFFFNKNKIVYRVNTYINSSSLIKHACLTFLYLIIIFLATITFEKIAIVKPNRWYWEGFTESRIGNCRYYLKKDVTKGFKNESGKDIKCNSSQYIYIISSPLIKRRAIFICNGDVQKNVRAQCKSEYKIYE